MNRITTDILKTAFRKLLSTTYYDKTDMEMRHHVAEFAKKLTSENDENRIFNELLSVAIGENEELLKVWLNGMSLLYFPKKLSAVDKVPDDHIITNSPPHQMKVERLMVKANIPVALCILDVAWLMLYGFKVDSKLYKHSYGNRMDLIPNDSGVRLGNSLFRKYQNQYKEWWTNGIKTANQHLKNEEDVTIINFDISNCYHSIDFNFDEFFAYYNENWPDDNIYEDALTKTIITVYKQYWKIAQNSGVDVFKGDNEAKRPLPLTLMSAHVLANWYLSPLDDFITEKYKPYYYGRYVDDCMVVLKTKSAKKTLKDSIKEELPELMDFKVDKTVFAFAEGGYKRLESFEIQKDKLYVYRFDCLLPQSSLDEFVQGQIERSSEYRFLTDDIDTSNVNLESITLVNTLDAEEEPGRRFNILEENKYKLAVYLAKLASRLAKYGKDYEHFEEVEKVYKYFQKGLLIKHYQLWERLMTIFVLAGKKDYVTNFENNAQNQINKLQIEDNLFGEKNKEVGVQQLKKCLEFHLEQSKNMAFSLHRESLNVDSLYLDTFMVRMHYNMLPLQEFSDDFACKGVMLTMDSFKLRKDLFKYRWMPYYVKYYAIVNALSIGEVYQPDVYEKAFEIYCELNHVGHSLDWMAFCRSPQGDFVTEFNVDLAWNPHYDDNLTVSVVEMDIEKQKAIDIIDDFGKVYAEKVTIFDNILDQITKIYKTDIFILPELSLPIYELMGYCRYAAKHERAFVSGMEFVVKDDIVYNYIITCLPITLYGQKDAVPVIRLKNHYAPEEMNDIRLKGKKVPIQSTWQNLYHWHGHVFTSYYCFELASIKERSFFYSMIDAMYCPVFNKDTYYFNNIAESMARDMHCYFILCNVSHYGDSRVTMPASHIIMNKLKVKGGNTIDNKAVVLSATLDVKSLREFQKKSQKEQDDDKKFKKTPPDYDKSNVEKRRSKRFFFQYNELYDQFLAKVLEEKMKY